MEQKEFVELSSDGKLTQKQFGKYWDEVTGGIKDDDCNRKDFISRSNSSKIKTKRIRATSTRST